MSERKCRKSITFTSTQIVRGTVKRGAALIRCDLREKHEGDHWCALLTPYKAGQKAKQVGYMFWNADR